MTLNRWTSIAGIVCIRGVDGRYQARGQSSCPKGHQNSGPYLDSEFGK